MKVFTIIVTYNAMNRGWIDRCLTSLRNSSVPVIPIVVDNASSDDTPQHVPVHYPEVVWLPQKKNWGFGQANNIGFRYALEHQADYVLLLNQDASLTPTAVEEMLKNVSEDALYTPVHLNGDGARLDFMFRGALLAHPDLLVDDLYLGKGLKPCYQIGEICAACWLLPVSVIRCIGGFNPLFFHYGEDGNYYQRLRYHGFKTFLVPAAQMMHDRQQFGNKEAFNHNRLHRDLLLVFCDINLSPLRRCIECLRVGFRYGWRHSPRFFYELGWFLLHATRIIHSRKNEKKKQLNWL